MKNKTYLLVISILLFCLAIIGLIKAEKNYENKLKSYCGKSQFIRSVYIENKYFVFCKADNNSIYVVDIK